MRGSNYSGNFCRNSTDPTSQDNCIGESLYQEYQWGCFSWYSLWGSSLATGMLNGKGNNRFGTVSRGRCLPLPTASLSVPTMGNTAYCSSTSIAAVDGAALPEPPSCGLTSEATTSWIGCCSCFGAAQCQPSCGGTIWRTVMVTGPIAETSTRRHIQWL